MFLISIAMYRHGHPQIILGGLRKINQSRNIMNMKNVFYFLSINPFSWDIHSINVFYNPFITSEPSTAFILLSS